MKKNGRISVIREIALKTQKRVTKIKELRTQGKSCTDSVELLDPVTINRYICDAEAFWDWCGLEDRSLPNPFGKQKVREMGNKKKKREPFTHELLSIIFHHLIFTEHKTPPVQILQPHHFFVPLIGVYTGLRIEEICQMHCTDVKKLHGIWMFDINTLDDKKLKNESSERHVPIHNDLIHFGLLTYLAELMEEGEALLFPNLLSKPNMKTGEVSYSNSVTVWFGRLLKSLNIKTKTLVFHSFRHTFANSYKQTTLKNYINLSDEIYRAALGILETVELEQPVRLLGISLSNLKHQAEQLPLFEEERKKLFATQAMDTLNDRFGRMSVTYGTLLPGKETAGSHVIPPSWRPDGVKNIDVE